MQKIKPSLFADEMFVYIENSKRYTKMLLELIIVFSKVNRIQEYKTNIQKSIVFLYTSSKHRHQNLKRNAI